jgi:hypothetical protein
MRISMKSILMTLCLLWPVHAFNRPQDTMATKNIGHRHEPIPLKVRVLEPEKNGSWPLRAKGPGWPLRVSWRYVDPAPGLAKILLLRNGQVVHTFSNGVSWGSAGKGFGDWPIPVNEYGPHSYRVQVVSTVDEKYSGSSVEFALVPFLKIWDPAHDGTTRKIGTTLKIVWFYSAACGDAVKIKAVTTNSQWAYDLETAYPIGAAYSGWYAWTIAPNIKPGEYRLFITGAVSFCWDRTPTIIVVP